VCIAGRSHDATFELFSEGRPASAALKHFAEVGKSEWFDVHRQGFDGVMDTFGADAITQGEGQAKAKFYMDANHSLVSLVVRMVPSPDWFIGVNSINLCSRDGQWEDKKHLQVRILAIKKRNDSIGWRS
jgi:spondin-2